MPISRCRFGSSQLAGWELWRCRGGFMPPYGEVNSPLQHQIDPLPNGALG